MKNFTDKDIIDSVKRGNHADYAILVNRYKNRAFSLLKRMLKNEQEAEEVLQDCFLKAFQSLEGFRAESKFSTWFYRITYNTALTRLASKKRTIENSMISIEDEINLAGSFCGSKVEEENFSEFLADIVDQLPAKFAAVITMFYLSGMSCDEISVITNNSVANVKVMLHRSRTALRELVEIKNFKRELL
jgi:RNA polymerase sigma factor, sigma-70 family